MRHACQSLKTNDQVHSSKTFKKLSGCLIEKRRVKRKRQLKGKWERVWITHLMNTFKRISMHECRDVTKCTKISFKFLPREVKYSLLTLVIFGKMTHVKKRILTWSWGHSNTLTVILFMCDDLKSDFSHLKFLMLALLSFALIQAIARREKDDRSCAVNYYSTSE